MEAGAGLADKDRTRLIDFAAMLRALLERFLARQPTLVSDQSLRLLRAAWKELQTEERFEGFIAAIGSGDYDRGLIEHGLYGNQLAMKVGLVEAAIEEVGADEAKFFRFFKKRKWIFRAALKAANVALGSAADAIPGGSIIKEFKDGVEAALDQQLPLRKRIRATFGRPRVKELAIESPPPETLGA
jgi:glutathione S-transferase